MKRAAAFLEAAEEGAEEGAIAVHKGGADPRANHRRAAHKLISSGIVLDMLCGTRRRLCSGRKDISLHRHLPDQRRPSCTPRYLAAFGLLLLHFGASLLLAMFQIASATVRSTAAMFS